MNFVIRGFSFIYIYYRIYVFFFFTCLASIIAIWRFKGFKNADIKKIVCVLMLFFLLDGVLSYMVYRTPLLYESITISENELYEEKDQSLILGVSSSYVFYENPGLWHEDGNGNVVVQVPAGRDRCVHIGKGEESMKYFLEDSSPCKILTECMMKTGILMVGGFLLSIFVLRVINFSFENFKAFFLNNSFGLFTFFVLITQFIFNKADKIDSWVSCWYATDYSMGVSSRFFIGSLLSLFYNDYLNERFAYYFCCMTIILLIICVSFLTNKAIRYAEVCTIDGVKFLVICFLCCPGSIAAMWTENGMGRLEMYTLLLSLGGVIAFNYIVNAGIRYILIMIIGVISISIYQGYLFLYFPIMFTVIICDIFKNSRVNFTHCIYGALSCIVVCVSFLWFQFFSYVIYEDVSSMVASLSQKTNLNVNAEAVYYECFATVTDAYKAINTKFFLENGEFPREKLFLTICILMPIVVIILSLYGKCFSDLKNKHKKIISTPYIYCALANLAVLPQFILNIDWGRWLTALTINVFFEILYLSYMGFPEIITALRSLSHYVKEHKETAVFCIIYLSFLDKFGASGFLPQVNVLWDGIFQRIF